MLHLQRTDPASGLQVTNTKYTADVRPLLALGKTVAGKQPKTFITDGAMNFHVAYKSEFRTARLENRTEHIRHIREIVTITAWNASTARYANARKSCEL